MFLNHMYIYLYIHMSYHKKKETLTFPDLKVVTSRPPNWLRS